MNPRHGLGRGLGALLGATTVTSPEVAQSPAQELPIDSIVANPQQPRKAFDSSSLQELSDSLKRTGLLQPVVVRRHGHQYQIVVGERRWRAAKMAGLSHIPAIVREATEAQSLELALVENLLREDLNPMEEAEAFQRLLTDFSWTQEELGERVGKDRSSVANFLRLLKLPELIQADLRTGRLTMGHARALLSLTSPDDQLKLREQILAHSWSVRTTEESVQTKRRPLPRRLGRRSADLTALEDSLRQTLATRVRVIGNERAGRIEIAYTSAEDLERLTELIVGRPA